MFIKATAQEALGLHGAMASLHPLNICTASSPGPRGEEKEKGEPGICCFADAAIFDHNDKF